MPAGRGRINGACAPTKCTSFLSSSVSFTVTRSLPYPNLDPLCMSVVRGVIPGQTTAADLLMASPSSSSQSGHVSAVAATLHLVCYFSMVRNRCEELSRVECRKRVAVLLLFTRNPLMSSSLLALPCTHPGEHALPVFAMHRCRWEYELTPDDHVLGLKVGLGRL